VLLGGVPALLVGGWLACVQRGVGEVESFLDGLDEATRLEIEGTFAPARVVSVAVSPGPELTALSHVVRRAAPSALYRDSWHATLGAKLATTEHVRLTMHAPGGPRTVRCVAGHLALPNRCTVVDLAPFDASDLLDELERLGLARRGR
jgi:hypothetical protein